MSSELTATRIAKIAQAVACAFLVTSCATQGSLPGFVYEPVADFGEVSVYGGCPGSSPSVRLPSVKPDWLRVHVGMWHSLQAELRQVSDATFFIAFSKQYPCWRWSESPQQYLARLGRTPVHVKSSASYITVSFEDGTQRRFDFPDFKGEFEFLGTSKVVNVPLAGISPQTLVVVLPDIYIDGSRLPGGPIRFTYKERDVRAVC
jgi:hypothetical protein